jgi:hypothetical protein
MNFSYETWKDIGMEFGPTFRNLTDMQVGDGSGIALCTVTIPELSASPYNPACDIGQHPPNIHDGNSRYEEEQSPSQA